MENITNVINEKRFSQNKVVLENRKKLTINGVEKTICSNENLIVLIVSAIKTFISGSNLRIEKLDVETGVCEISGVVSSFKFGNEKTSFFKKVFK